MLLTLAPFFWEPPTGETLVPLLAASILGNWALAWRIAASVRQRSRRLWLGFGVTANLLLLAYFKYAGFLVTNINAVTGAHWDLGQIILPIGIPSDMSPEEALKDNQKYKVVWQVLQTRINFGPLSALFGGHEVTLTEVVAVLLGAGLYIWFIRLLFSGISHAEKGRMIMLMTLITVSALFWGLYEQTYGPWVAMADRVMDRTTFGIEWTAGQTTAIGALFVIALSPVFAWIWPRLDKAGLNPSYPAKFAWGLLFCGLAFGVLAFASANAGDEATVSLWWMILAYFVLVLGEMVLSPVGLAAVTSLSIPRAVGMMMGAWFLFSAFGEIIAGRMGTWAAIEPEADGSISTAKALAVYGDVFTDMMWIGLAAGVLMFALTPMLKKLMRPG